MATKRQTELSKALRGYAPMIPFDEAQEVNALANQRHLRHLPASIAVWLSLVAHIRHVHTDYDVLLSEGYDRDAARHFVIDDINAMLADWQGSRRVESDEPDQNLPDPVEDQSG